MSKDKLYLPADDSYDKFVIIAASKQGIIVPMNFLGHPHLHITLYIKKLIDKSEAFKLSIHITDIIRQKIVKEFYFEFSEATIKEKYIHKIEELIPELLSIFLDSCIKEENLDKSALYCVDCSLADMNMPKAMKSSANSKEFWQKFHQNDNIKKVPLDKCTNIEHKQIWDLKNEKLYFKLATGDYLEIDEEYNFLEKLKTLVNEYFGEELRAVDDIIAQAELAITEHNNKYKTSEKLEFI
jgi:hypothetical protein